MSIGSILPAGFARAGRGLAVAVEKISSPLVHRRTT
jgi:hypothetical protein